MATDQTETGEIAASVTPVNTGTTSTGQTDAAQTGAQGNTDKAQ